MLCLFKCIVPTCFSTNQLCFTLERQNRPPEGMGLTYPRSASKAGFLSPCIFIWFFPSFSTSLFLPVCLPESLLFIYSVIPVCTDAGGSSARHALRIQEQEHSLLPCQGRHIAASGAPGLCCAFPLQVGAGPSPLLCSRLLQHVPLQEPTPRWWQEPI